MLTVRSRRSADAPQGRAYEMADPRPSRSARILASIFIGLAAFWQSAGESDAAPETPSDTPPAPKHKIVAPEIASADVAPAPLGADDRDGSDLTGSGPVIDKLPGGAAPALFRMQQDAAPAEAGSVSDGVTPDPSTDATSVPEAPSVSLRGTGGSDLAVPIPLSFGPHAPQGQSPEPYTVEDLLLDLLTSLERMPGVDAQPLLELAVGDWLSAAQLDLIRRSGEALPGRADWDSYQHDRETTELLSTPAARDDFVDRFLTNSSQASAVDAGPVDEQLLPDAILP